MLGISLAELSIIVLIGIIIIPPKELPRVIQFVTKLYQRIQKMYVKLLRELNLLNLD